MKKYLFVIVILFGLITCQETCPKFDEEILSWIPQVDVIELYFQAKDSTIILPIESVVVTHTANLTRGFAIGCKKCAPECYDYISIGDDDSIFQIDISLRGNYITHQSYRIYDTFFYTFSEIENFIFENTEYDKVQVFNNHSNETFKKLIVAKGFGIIGLVDIHDNTWVLKTNAKNKGTNERENIVFKNVSSSSC